MQRRLSRLKLLLAPSPPNLCSSEPFNFLSGLLRNPSALCPSVCIAEEKKILVRACARPSLCKFASVSPGRGDTGISGDEPQMEQAVIEVFKKVRGD